MQGLKYFHWWKCFWKCCCKMEAILSLSQYVQQFLKAMHYLDRNLSDLTDADSPTKEDIHQNMYLFQVKNYYIKFSTCFMWETINSLALEDVDVIIDMYVWNIFQELISWEVERLMTNCTQVNPSGPLRKFTSCRHIIGTIQHSSSIYLISPQDIMAAILQTIFSDAFS